MNFSNFSFKINFGDQFYFVFYKHICKLTTDLNKNVLNINQFILVLWMKILFNFKMINHSFWNEDVRTKLVHTLNL